MYRLIALLSLLVLAACQPSDGRRVQAPSGISASQVNGNMHGGGADPGYSGRGSYGTFGLGR